MNDAKISSTTKTHKADHNTSRKVIAAPTPTRILFDPYQTSSTGHQRDACVLAGTKSWRDSRNHKMTAQFSDTTGGGGTGHVLDMVGAGSKEFGKDGRRPNGSWEVGARETKEAKDMGWGDIRGWFGEGKKTGRVGKMTELTVVGKGSEVVNKRQPYVQSNNDKEVENEKWEKMSKKRKREDIDAIDQELRGRSETDGVFLWGSDCRGETPKADTSSLSAAHNQLSVRLSQSPLQKATQNMQRSIPSSVTEVISVPATSKSASSSTHPPQIFRNLVMYQNGSTFPLISDHRLKQLWVLHGGSTSLHLGRRTVTHVILGDSQAGPVASDSPPSETNSMFALLLSSSIPSSNEASSSYSTKKLDPTNPNSPPPSSQLPLVPSSSSTTKSTTSTSKFHSVGGGGLSNTKIQKEISNIRGKNVKYVTVKWVLDSVEKGIRQPEAKYIPKRLENRIGGAGVGSVWKAFGKTAEG